LGKGPTPENQFYRVLRAHHFEHAAFDFPAGPLGIAPAQRGVRNFDGVVGNRREAPEERLRHHPRGFGIVRPGAQLHFQPGNQDGSQRPLLFQVVEHAHVAADVSRLHAAEKCLVAAFAGETADFQLPLRVAEPPHLRIRGGKSGLHRGPQIFLEALAVDPGQQIDPGPGSQHQHEDQQPETQAEHMKHRRSLRPAACHRIPDLEPKSLACHPLAQTFVEILRLLSFHKSKCPTAGKLKPPASAEAREICLALPLPTAYDLPRGIQRLQSPPRNF